MIYASDGPVCSPRIEVEKVRLAGLDPDAERLVLGENALRILEAVRVIVDSLTFVGDSLFGPERTAAELLAAMDGRPASTGRSSAR